MAAIVAAVRRVMSGEHRAADIHTEGIRVASVLWHRGSLVIRLYVSRKAIQQELAATLPTCTIHIQEHA